VGTFLQLVVFELDEEQLLYEAGPWGTLGAVALVAVMVLPAVAGVAFGIRGRRLGERRLGTAGIVANAAIACYVVVAAGAGLLLG
jgi:hypothetical protein